MIPSSRTPEGTPGRCPVCGKDVCIEPSVPPGDAPCPHCGHLLWLDDMQQQPVNQTGLQRDATPEVAPLPVPDLGPPTRFGFDAAAWSINGLFCGLLIVLADESPVSAAFWMAVCLGIGLVGLPALIRSAENVSQRRRSLWLDVMFGWGLIPGPLIGSAFGALCPLLWEVPFTILQGAFIGLVVGPLLAPLEGLLIAALAIGIVWLATGKRLDTA